MALFAVVFFGYFVHLIEPNSFPTWFDGIWWAIITASTVGYGDYVPETFLGRFTGILLVMTGAGFLASYFVALATAAVSKQNDYIQGKFRYKGSDHIVVIGWNERSREILRTICSYENSVPVTLIDETLEENPLPDKQLHFVKGRANRDEVLLKANIEKSRKVIITADQNKDELNADMNSILTLLAIKGLNPDVPCIVEILTSEQTANAKRAGADEVVQTNMLTSFVMINSLTSQEMVTSFLGLLSQLDERKLSFHPASIELIGKSFVEINERLMQDGVLLLGVKRGEETVVNPPHPFIITENDFLIVLMN
nr:potassium channel family protein [Cytobacillus purgationiresistens]